MTQFAEVAVKSVFMYGVHVPSFDAIGKASNAAPNNIISANAIAIKRAYFNFPKKDLTQAYLQKQANTLILSQFLLKDCRSLKNTIKKAENFLMKLSTLKL